MVFRYIENDIDARCLYDIFTSTITKYKDANLSDEELFRRIEDEYYIQYVVQDVINQIKMDEDDAGFVLTYHDYDGNDGYDN